jgi:hypothetical protein
MSSRQAISGQRDPAKSRPADGGPIPGSIFPLRFFLGFSLIQT